jgi:ATP-dependent Lon protease
MSAQDPLLGQVLENKDLEKSSSVLPTTLYLLPLTDKPFFPAQTQPLLLNDEALLSAVRQAVDTPDKMIGLIAVDKNRLTEVTPENFFSVGTACRIHCFERFDHETQYVAEGVKRFRIVKWLSTDAPFQVQVEYLDEPEVIDQQSLKAYADAIKDRIMSLLPMHPRFADELKFYLNRINPNDLSQLADFAASLTNASKEKLQQVLETIELRRRMLKVLVLQRRELEAVQPKPAESAPPARKMSRQERELYLRRQLKEIQKELGIPKNDKATDIERFEERLKKLEPALNADAVKRVSEEIRKLSVLETGSPEYALTRNYLEWLTTLPWGVHSDDNLDLVRARKILDEEHDGLEDVKKRIIEFLAVGTLRGEVAGSIILLVGPPGVGKTSIGRSIAKVLNRKFYRFSLGGMRDEAEIKGHRRTYVGAMPGKFVQAMKDVETSNPVIMLDEIDKMSSSYHGDPASAMLEVLDPEQNVDFLDHYLDVRFDLSKVLFICTANQLDTIPDPLLDRMEIIRLSGYITAEKVQIAKRHLWPRLLERTGVKRGDLVISVPAVRHVVEGYAREAGVRNVEKQLGRLVRKAVVDIVGGKETPIKIGIKQVEEYLGEPVFLNEEPMSAIGVITGLAWTAMGGALLIIEATKVHTKNRGFKLTGQLGDVMRESAEIAYSYIMSHIEEYGGDPDFFDEAFVHLHVPEGAVPKDGPSAGITIASALLSLARDEKTVRHIAMTGELTLTGQVLAVGGVREKVIAAKRVGMLELIMPEANKRDFNKLPDYVREGFTIHYVKHYKEVAKILFP